MCLFPCSVSIEIMRNFFLNDGFEQKMKKERMGKKG